MVKTKVPTADRKEPIIDLGLDLPIKRLKRLLEALDALQKGIDDEDSEDKKKEIAKQLKELEQENKSLRGEITPNEETKERFKEINAKLDAIAEKVKLKQESEPADEDAEPKTARKRKITVSPEVKRIQEMKDRLTELQEIMILMDDKDAPKYQEMAQEAAEIYKKLTKKNLNAGAKKEAVEELSGEPSKVYYKTKKEFVDRHKNIAEKEEFADAVEVRWDKISDKEKKSLCQSAWDRLPAGEKDAYKKTGGKPDINIFIEKEGLGILGIWLEGRRRQQERDGIIDFDKRVFYEMIARGYRPEDAYARKAGLWGIAGKAGLGIYRVDGRKEVISNDDCLIWEGGLKKDIDGRIEKNLDGKYEEAHQKFVDRVERHKDDLIIEVIEAKIPVKKVPVAPTAPTRQAPKKTKPVEIKENLDELEKGRARANEKVRGFFVNYGLNDPGEVFSLEVYKELIKSGYEMDDMEAVTLNGLGKPDKIRIKNKQRGRREYRIDEFLEKVATVEKKVGEYNKKKGGGKETDVEETINVTTEETQEVPVVINNPVEKPAEVNPVQSPEPPKAPEVKPPVNMPEKPVVKASEAPKPAEATGEKSGIPTPEVNTYNLDEIRDALNVDETVSLIDMAEFLEGDFRNLKPEPDTRTKEEEERDNQKEHTARLILTRLGVDLATVTTGKIWSALEALEAAAETKSEKPEEDIKKVERVNETKDLQELYSVVKDIDGNVGDFIKRGAESYRTNLISTIKNKDISRLNDFVITRLFVDLEDDIYDTIQNRINDLGNDFKQSLITSMRELDLYDGRRNYGGTDSAKKEEMVEKAKGKECDKFWENLNVIGVKYLEDQLEKMQ